MIGSTLANRYHVLREIGRGGMGVVYHARDPLLERDVAVKVLHPEAMTTSAAERFEREARVIAKMDHPSIMNVFDIGRHDGSIFFVMPLARGSTLRAMIDRGPIDADTLAKIALEITEALQHSHASGIVHRDIKPENIMIAESGDELRAVVTDFGLAVSESEDAKSDIRALGMMMNEALRIDSADAELRRIATWCLESEPSAAELAEALRRCRTRHAVATRLIGRAKEMQTIERMLDSMRVSEARLLLIAGEAGMGKTRILEQIDSLCALRNIAIRPLPPAPAKEKRELFEQHAAAISRESRGQPLVLTSDEIQSAELLEFLLNRLAPIPLLIVAAYRPSALGRRDPLHGLVEHDRRVQLLTLRPLGNKEHREALEQILGQGSVSELANERIFAVTEGNPFFVQELARALAESRTRAEEADLDAQSLPPTIQSAVERRIETLDARTRVILETASVIGRSFDAGDVEHLLDAADVDAHLERLTREGFLREERGRGERFTFSSALTREVAYAGVARRRRRALHRKYAELLEGRSALAELVHHYAEADEAEKVIEHGLQFGRKSLDAFNTTDALRATRLVIDFLDDDVAREIEARTLAARAHRIDGNVEAALRELEVMSRLIGGEAERLLVVAADAAETAWEGRRIEEAGRWVERGLASGGSTADPMRRLLSIAANLANLRGDAESARSLFDRKDTLEIPSPAMLAGRGGVIRVPISGSLLSLDPALSFTLTNLETLAVVYETLTRETDAARVAPWLASSIDADDGGHRFRIELREARFHDGRVVTADDVRHSFERLLRSSSAESRWMLGPIAGARAYGEGSADRIEGLRVESDRRLALELQEPVSFFPAVLAHLPAAVIPAGEAGIGTGPYRVVNFEIGRELRLEASPHYWREGSPRADGIVFTFGVAPAEIARGLRDGTYDVGWDLLPNDFDALRRDPRFARGLRETPRLSTYYIAFNIHRGPLGDEALRRELRDSLDVAGLVATLGRVAVPARGFIPPGLLGYEPARSVAPRSAASSSASRLTLQAMLNSAYQGPYAAFAGRLFEAFAAAGVDISVIEGKSEYVTNQAEALAGAEILFTRWIADFPDAHDFAALLHSRTGLVGRLCGTPEVDSLIERGARESNPEVRHQLYREIEDILAERALIVPLFHEQSYRFARPEVQDFAVNYFAPVVAYDKIWIA